MLQCVFAVCVAVCVVVCVRVDNKSKGPFGCETMTRYMLECVRMCCSVLARVAVCVAVCVAMCVEVCVVVFGLCCRRECGIFWR